MKTAFQFLSLGVLCLLPAVAPAQMTIDEIRLRSLNAIDTNSAKSKNILYHKREWMEFSGRALVGPLSSTGGSAVHFTTPAWLSHVEFLNGELVDLFDRWEDQDPINAKLEDRKSNPNRQWRPIEGIKQLLTEAHRLNLTGTVSDGGHKAYVIAFGPSQSAPPPQSTPSACQSFLLSGKLLIDSDTFFPIQLDAKMDRPNKCWPAPTSPPQMGTLLRAHFILVRGAARGGQVSKIYVRDKGETIYPPMRLTGVNLPFRKFPEIQGEEMTVKDISVSSEFKIFLTSVVFHYEGEIVPNSSANSPTDFAETESYFNLDGEPARVGSPPGAPQ